MAATVDALRQRAADALECGLAFVDRRGDAHQQLRARAALGALPPAELLAEWRGRQRADGSFDDCFPRAGGPLAGPLGALEGGSELAGTLVALSELADVHALEGAAVARAVEFAQSRQEAAGGWGGEWGLEESALLCVTGLLAGVLGRTGAARPAGLAAAGSLLIAHWAPERVEQGRWSERTGFASYFCNVPHERSDDVLQWCGRAMESDFRTRRCDALATLRSLLCCDALALPGASLTPGELLQALLDEQGADGGFDELAGDTPAARADATLDALLGIPLLARALPRE